ncbi:hypothetical protein NHX12_027425 [Muraenolepis orangiensis]|uniref:CKK domain-containing protein n=1 Tax=Muraenolepis orangiensis TaxID=630683 RepID=A0A9Q0EFH4_9TELE|nr:hypothetical protein NHX12_027425 [Muraenolepis orangiensis]
MDACAGRDGTWRTAGVADTMDIDIVPNSFYDPAKAKIYANLRWLFAKAYGTDTPEDLRELSYVDQYEQEHIKPSVLQLLLSGELYCRVCGLILKGVRTPSSSSTVSLHGHQAVIKALLRRGIHVVEADEYVSDHDLSSTPIKMSAHITLIDALMTAYASERVSTDRAGSSCGRFSNPGALAQGPLENTLVSWINKVVIKMREISASEHMRKEHLRDAYNNQKGRCPDSPEENPHHFPLLDSLMNNIFTATALLTVIHFYCPAIIRLEDICLKETPPVAETISNIQLLMAFSNKHLNRGFHLKIEDMLYCPPALNNNMIAFIAELFWMFEKVKPNFVQPRDPQGMKDGLGTKPSFSTCEPQDSLLAWPERKKSPVFRPLYHQEPNSLRTTSLDGAGFSLARATLDPPGQTHQGNTTPSLPRHSPGAGLKGPPGRCMSQGLLGHVYISDEENEVEDEELVVIVHPPLAAGQRWDGASGDAFLPGAYSVDHQAQESFYLEPLLPAVSKPSKEKSVSLNKQEESGDTPRVRANVYTHSSSAAQRQGHPETEPLDLRATSIVTTPTRSEHKNADDSRSPSPCHSTTSQASSSCCSASDSSGVRMTSFADRKLKKKKIKSGGGGGSSPTGSSQRTTPDYSETTFPPPVPHGGSMYPRGDPTPCWQVKESSGGFGLEKEGVAGSPAAVGSELVQLHMQLVEQQRAIEGQKKKMETVFTQQRLELGKAAFLNIIKKGGGKSDTLPRPLKRSPEILREISTLDGGRGKIHPSKDDTCLDELSLKKSMAPGKIQAQGRRDNRLNPTGLPYTGGEPDLYGFCYSLDNLNKSVSSIQQEIMQLSLQQSRLMKQGVATPTPSSPDSETPTKGPPLTPQTPPAAISFSIADFASPGNSGFDEPVIVPSEPAESEDEDNNTSSEMGDSIAEEVDCVNSDVVHVEQSDSNVAVASNCHADNEQKNGLGFFYKHEEKAEDELAKRRAAFLLKQERKAEEARLRKQQQEADNELKRDEARLKAEEDRSLSARRPRLKSPQHPGSLLPKASPRDDPSSSHRGSTLSLAAEPDDMTSGRSFSRCSEDSFSVMSVDWDKRSTASFSLTADYNGPKLFKEPTSKSNKTIIINAVAHCCLAGKVNETQKNVVLEELEKCKANHLLILLRDGGCQYRGIYCYLTDTEEIVKFLGTGPRTITRKMTDKLFKYSCDRKQFGVIPTKTLSITVDALTIHNHLWQVKRKGSLTMKK